jgi:hypothetical protein
VVNDKKRFEQGFLHLNGLNEEERHVIGDVTASETAFDFGIHQLFTSEVSLHTLLHSEKSTQLQDKFYLHSFS